MKQWEIADLFERIANLLEWKGENPFRIRAYRKAALNLRHLSGDLEERVRSGTLEEIPGIGKDLAHKITEAVQTGRIAYLKELEREVPPEVVEWMAIPGMGPKTARLIYEHFKVTSIQALETLIRSKKLRTLPGFRAKREENLLKGIELLKAGRERMPLGMALEMAKEVVQAIKEFPEVRRVSVAGSLRRYKDTVKDLDILVTSQNPQRVMDRFIRQKFVARIQAHGQTKSSILTHQGIQVDLRVVDPESFGAAWVYFTGSKAHNIKIRSLANRKGLTINEYGVFREATGRRIAGREEEEVYRALGLPWIPPELREDWGEVEAAQDNRLPRLIDAKDIVGSFHNHSRWSDGAHSVEELAKAIRARGYRYMVLSDHSRFLRVAGGLSESELLRQRQEVQALNQRLKPFRILMGAEVDILPDGRLDYSDRILRMLDIVIVAVHSAFKQPKAVMTRRILRAIEHPLTHILAHPTGRLLGEREPYEADWEEVMRSAAKNHVALEINCFTRRLDLNDAQARQARELGARLVIATDTHVLGQLDDLALGIALARRAWATAQDILNTMTLQQVCLWASKRGLKESPVFR